MRYPARPRHNILIKKQRRASNRGRKQRENNINKKMITIDEERGVAKREKE